MEEAPTDSRLPECGQPPGIRSPDAHGIGTRGESLENVPSAPEAAVHENGGRTWRSSSDLGKAIQGRTPWFEGAPSMIRDNDAIDLML
jgi:hypothetical protein